MLLPQKAGNTEAEGSPDSRLAGLGRHEPTEVVCSVGVGETLSRNFLPDGKFELPNCMSGITIRVTVTGGCERCFTSIVIAITAAKSIGPAIRLVAAIRFGWSIKPSWKRRRRKTTRTSPGYTPTAVLIAG